ncbi:MAG: MarR family winged helix-turn-helix transcriptional regulator [Caulobacteraceae bacterium]
MSETSAPESRSSGAAMAHHLRLFSRRLKRRLRDQSDTGDLTPSQVAVIHRLEEGGPATTSALARAEGMRSQSMGAVVAALEASGLIVGAPDPSDGRQTLLALTEHCRTWLSQGRAARQDWLSSAIEDRLSRAEQAQLTEALPLLLRLVADRDEL